MTTHADWCEADGAHDYDCATATRLSRLTAFAESVRDEFLCTQPADEDGPCEIHEEDCWHHAALLALARPGR